MRYTFHTPSSLIVSSRVIFSYLIFKSTNRLYSYGISLSKAIFSSFHFPNVEFPLVILFYLIDKLLLLIFGPNSSLRIFGVSHDSLDQIYDLLHQVYL